MALVECKCLLTSHWLQKKKKTKTTAPQLHMDTPSAPSDHMFCVSHCRSSRFLVGNLDSSSTHVPFSLLVGEQGQQDLHLRRGTSGVHEKGERIGPRERQMRECRALGRLDVRNTAKRYIRFRKGVLTQLMMHTQVTKYSGR